jgi:hypothetical protein
MINKVIMVGRVGNASTVVKTDGTLVLKLSIALDNSYKKPDGSWVKSTAWVRVNKYRPSEKQANIGKGDLVMVDGHLTSGERGLYVSPDKLLVLQKKNAVDAAPMSADMPPFDWSSGFPAFEQDAETGATQPAWDSNDAIWSGKQGEAIEGDDDADIPF